MNKTQERMLRRKTVKNLEISYPQTLKQAKKVGAYEIETDKNGELLSYRLPKGWENVIIDEFIVEAEGSCYTKKLLPPRLLKYPSFCWVCKEYKILSILEICAECFDKWGGRENKSLEELKEEIDVLKKINEKEMGWEKWQEKIKKDVV